MPTLIMALVMMCLVSSLKAQAFETIHEPQIMVYYKIPFGGKTKDEKQHIFGIRADYTQPEVVEHTDGAAQALSGSTANFELQLTRDGIKALNVHGQNVLDENYALKESSDGNDVWLIVGGLGLAALVVAALVVDDDEEPCPPGQVDIGLGKQNCLDPNNP